MRQQRGKDQEFPLDRRSPTKYHVPRLLPPRCISRTRIKHLKSDHLLELTCRYFKLTGLALSVDRRDQVLFARMDVDAQQHLRKKKQNL